jgi:hypothetical protein
MDTSACKGDIEKHCKAAGKDNAKIVECLVANRAALTPPCQQALDHYEKLQK